MSNIVLTIVSATNTGSVKLANMENQFLSIRSKATKAGFDQYTDTVNDNGVRGIILVAEYGTKYFGEVIDLFEDGSFIQYSQFKNDPNRFNPL